MYRGTWVGVKEIMSSETDFKVLIIYNIILKGFLGEQGAVTRRVLFQFCVYSLKD